MGLPGALVLVLLVLLAGSGSLAGEDPLAAEVEALAGLSSVEGEASGVFDSPGGFFARSEAFVARGERADFERLLAHRSPVVRAMGLFCLVRTAGADALPWLRRHLADPGRFEVVPYG